MNIIDKDKQLAMEFAEKLSDFYREIVLLQDKEMVTVEEEINLLKNYIYLQQKRFGNNLQLSLNIFEAHKKAGIPPLTLQLLAENALKHNTVDENNPLIIKIESAQSFLIVSNNITKQESAGKISRYWFKKYTAKGAIAYRSGSKSGANRKRIQCYYTNKTITMRILIIEDEENAIERLEKLINEVAPDKQIVGKCKSIQQTFQWLQ